MSAALFYGNRFALSDLNCVGSCEHAVDPSWNFCPTCGAQTSKIADSNMIVNILASTIFKIPVENVHIFARDEWVYFGEYVAATSNTLEVVLEHELDRADITDQAIGYIRNILDKSGKVAIADRLRELCPLNSRKFYLISEV